MERHRFYTQQQHLEQLMPAERSEREITFSIFRLISWGLSDISREPILNWALYVTVKLEFEVLGGRSLLLTTLQKNSIGLFQLLLTELAGKLKIDSVKHPPLIQNGSKLLFEKQLFFDDATGISILQLAALYGRLKAVEFLRPGHKDRVLYTHHEYYSNPLHLAVVGGHLGVAKAMMGWPEIPLGDVPDMHNWTSIGYIEFRYLRSEDSTLAGWKEVYEKLKGVAGPADDFSILEPGRQIQYPSVGPMFPPFAWSERQRPIELTSDESKHVVFYKGEPDVGQTYSLMANHPIPYTVVDYYLEIQIITASSKGSLYIGLTHAYSPIDTLPGKCPCSFGLSDLGVLHHQGMSRVMDDDFQYQEGDTIGLGLIDGEVYFTKNGKFIGRLEAETPLTGKLFPSIGIQTSHYSDGLPEDLFILSANFNGVNEPFLFSRNDPANITILREAGFSLMMVQDADETEFDLVIQDAVPPVEQQVPDALPQPRPERTWATSKEIPGLRERRFPGLGPAIGRVNTL
ncbi:hypothetical protein BJ508DRAFT_324756 [Ascobolus immersus RN42]|uniref:SPRY domain-containing protein n=1 Tax=Ascobolus immersus RN42 TaxID=1160509 RepID=A0A3N4IAP8_ASCIM|nr:hypothetical protein BJ508DRAFT_324756 [Ascobolus immersus RN42]